MKALRFLLTLLKPFPGKVFLSILLGTATITANIGLMGTSAYLIARAAEHPSIAYLQVAIVGVRFFGLTRGLFRYLERLVSHALNFKLLADLRVWVFQHLEPLAPGGLVDRMGGDLLETMMEDVEILENFYIRAVSPPLVALLVLGGASLFIGQFSAMIGLILFAGLTISGIVMPAGAYLLTRSTGRKMVLLKAEINSSLIEDLQGIEDLLVYGHGEEVINHIDALSNKLGRLQTYQAIASGLSGGINLFVTHLTLWTALYFSIALVRLGKLDGVMMAVIALIILASFEATTPMALVAQNMENSLTAAQRILEIAQKTPPVTDSIQVTQEIGGPFHLDMRELWFRYDQQGDWVLKDIYLDLEAGKKVALVGPSGAGKTSLVQLMLRFYPFERGKILLNGINIERIRQETVREHISMVAQSVYIFNQSIRNNLKLANPQSSDDEMLAVIHQVGMDEWLTRQPDGLDTLLGEQGAFMSGGERQRLSLARALLQNADLIIFDEPTANLDAVNSKEVLHSLLNPTEGKSVLWITHHLVGLEALDEILVMENGEIVERGSHDQLILNNGPYFKMWRIQHNLI